MTPPNPALQLTAFGARDRCFLNVIPCSAPRPQLNAMPLGRTKPTWLKKLFVVSGILFPEIAILRGCI
jgi:hypothetical protein